jgi:uncharacterized protein YqjF (DUF2071 family)
VITRRINCTIERRLLVNYRIAPELVAVRLPAPLRPQLVKGYAVGGICFIRLADTRPAHLPKALGLRTENVAHRFAVEWDDRDGVRTGVYVPRRDTNSLLASISGDRVFPGRYGLARFSVSEQPGQLDISVHSRDRRVQIHVTATASDNVDSRLFDTEYDAMEFFRQGRLGYSPAAHRQTLDAVSFASDRWEARPVHISHMRSSLFDNPADFPPGSCTLDSGLLMENLQAAWTTQDSLATSCPSIPA